MGNMMMMMIIIIIIIWGDIIKPTSLRFKVTLELEFDCCKLLML
jgi:hypothetical protein